MDEDQVMSELDLFGEMDRVADPVWEPAIDYTIVDRQATTVLHDSYSAGYCHLFKWETRQCGHMPETQVDYSALDETWFHARAYI